MNENAFQQLKRVALSSTAVGLALLVLDEKRQQMWPWGTVNREQR